MEPVTLLAPTGLTLRQPGLAGHRSQTMEEETHADDATLNA